MSGGLATPVARRARALGVVHVLTEPTGGGGVHVAELVRAGREAGHAPVVAIPALRGDGPDRRHPLELAQLVRRADVVHCHGVRAALVLPPVAGTPVVVTAHGLHGLRGPAGPRARALRALTRAALGRATCIVAVGEDDARDVAALGPRLAARTVVIVNGVSPLPVADDAARADARARLALAADEPVLLFAGSLIHQKHPELAVRAAGRARRRVPGLRLLVAGDGELMGNVRAIAGPGVSLLGRRDDVPALMAASDAVISTSRWEGLSLTLLEALWRGRPVVATRVPGNAEAVGEAGLMTDEDEVSVEEAIVRLFTEPGVRERLGAAARARAEQRFDATRMSAETLALHARLAR